MICVFDSVAVDLPVITLQPMSMGVGEGASVTFNVSAYSGDGILNYQWLKNGFEMPGETSSTLVLSSVMDDDEGAYSVNVTNSLLSTSSYIATLTVGKYLQ